MATIIDTIAAKARGLLAPLAKQLQQPFDIQSIISRGADAPTKGVAELHRAYTTSPWLRSVLGKISQHTAAVEWTLEVPRNVRGKAVRVRSLQRASGSEYRATLRRRMKQAVVLETLHEHPLLDLLDDANPQMTGMDARETTMLHLDIKGETFWILEVDELLGVPTAYWPVPSHWVTRTPTGDRPTFEVNMNGQRRDIPAAHMIWMRYRNPGDPYGRGTGYAEALATEIDTDEYAGAFIKTFFFNRAVPEMLFTVEGADSEQLEEAQLKFESKHRGWQRAHRSHWVGQKVDVKELARSFADTEIVNLRSWERDAFRGVFGVPAEIMGLTSNSNRAAITQAMRIMASEVVVPRLEFLRAQMQSYLVPLFDDRLIIDYVSPVPDDRDLELSYVQAVPYAATRGELRERQGLENRGDVDNVHMMPLNLITAEPGDEGFDFGSPTLAMGREKATEAPEEFDALADRIVQNLKPEPLILETEPIWPGEIDDWGVRVQRDLGIEPKLAQIQPLRKIHMEEFAGQRIVDINDSSKESLRGVLSKGIAEGLGADELAKLVEKVRDDWVGRRSIVIARTEVVRSANFATWAGHKTSGVVDRRRWVTTRDGRERPAHATLDGTEVGMDEKFVSGSATAIGPGHFGVAKLDIQCRCTTVAVIKDPEESYTDVSLDRSMTEAQLDAAWKQFDAEALKWEARAIKAFQRAFNIQISEIELAIDRVIPRSYEPTAVTENGCSVN